MREVRSVGNIDQAKYKIDQARSQIDNAQYNLKYYRQKEAEEAQNLQAAEKLLQEGEADLEQAMVKINQQTSSTTTGIGL